MTAEANVGVVGLAAMGASLARNLARHGNKVAVFNRHYSRTEKLITEHGSEGEFFPAKTMEEFVASLKKPRTAIIMVKAGEPTDAMIGQLADHRVGRLARLDHDDRGARLLQRRHEFLHRLRGEELALAAMLGDEFLGTRIVTVEHRHLVAVTGEIAGEARSHCGQSDDTDVCFSGHAVSFRRG